MAVKFRITLDSLVFELSQFAKAVVLRTRPNIAQITYSANGTPLYDGSFYEPPYEWNVEALISDTQRDTLARIFEQSRSQREEVTIEDYVTKHVDYGAQTREEATGASVTTSGGFAAYYAKYLALFDSEPTYERVGIYWRVVMVIKESAIVAIAP